MSEKRRKNLMLRTREVMESLENKGFTEDLQHRESWRSISLQWRHFLIVAKFCHNYKNVRNDILTLSKCTPMQYKFSTLLYSLFQCTSNPKVR